MGAFLSSSGFFHCPFLYRAMMRRNTSTERNSSYIRTQRHEKVPFARENLLISQEKRTHCPVSRNARRVETASMHYC